MQSVAKTFLVLLRRQTEACLGLLSHNVVVSPEGEAISSHSWGLLRALALAMTGCCLAVEIQREFVRCRAKADRVEFHLALVCNISIEEV